MSPEFWTFMNKLVDEHGETLGLLGFLVFLFMVVLVTTCYGSV